jgi:hypothetical protein
LAALCLYDGEVEVSSDNIATLLAGSNNTVAPYWPALFANALKGSAIETMIFSVGSASAGAAGTGSVTTADAGNLLAFYFIFCLFYLFIHFSWTILFYFIFIIFAVECVNHLVYFEIIYLI